MHVQITHLQGVFGEIWYYHRNIKALVGHTRCMLLRYRYIIERLEQL